MSEYKISLDAIEAFLHGEDDEHYIVNIEYDYKTGVITKIIDDPIKGKMIVEDTFRPFLWMKNPDKENFGDQLYDGRSDYQLAELKNKGLSITKLRTDGNDRMERGFCYLLESKTTENPPYAIKKYFKDGGVLEFGRSADFLSSVPPIEQYLIQKGKRLFKGIEEPEDLHKFYFDIETTGLDPHVDRIFAIGMYDNRGYENVLWCLNDEEERQAIIGFFNVIDELKPSVIAGYNSESFDWNFFVVRCEILGLDIKKIAKTRHKDRLFDRVEKTLKLGNEVETYTQTVMWGYDIIDIYHAVRRAQAIDSNLKKGSLKYVCKYNKVAKPNRVYIPGNKIYKTAIENVDYLFNKNNGNYLPLSDKRCDGWLEKRPDIYEKIDGKELVKRYLVDDLWETMMVDSIYNQTPFLLTKMVPSTYGRISTMGTAGYWRLLMSAWSYLNKLAIPLPEEKRDFVGGLSRLLLIGYAKKLAKADYKSLYPGVMLAHDVFPDVDIMGALKSMLKYFHHERFMAKKLSEKYKKEGNGQLAAKYKRKQLPLKIFINSMYGALTAPHAFPWGSFDKGEQVTCTGRQYLRLMVKFFMARGFIPVVLDTDGVNFVCPDNVDTFRYVGKGLHEDVEKDFEYTGLDAIFAEFNDLYMQGEMGLDIDGKWPATVNVSRKNYILLNSDGTLSLTGNTIKSKVIPEYVEDFFNEALPLLLNDKGLEFVEYYNMYAEKIFNQQIPLRKIANKSRVKQNIESYKNRGTNKNGDLLPKQAHMELAILNNLNIHLGDTIYYVNNGTQISHGDTTAVYETNDDGQVIKYLVDEEGQFVLDGNGKMIVAKRGELCEPKQIGIYAYYLDYDELEKDPERTGPYNIPKMMDTFNNRVLPLLVAFHPNYRNSILRIVEPNADLINKRKDLIRYKKLREKLIDKHASNLIKIDNKKETKLNNLKTAFDEKVEKTLAENKSISKLQEKFEIDKSNTITAWEEGIKKENEMYESELNNITNEIDRLTSLEFPEYTLSPKSLFMSDDLKLVSGYPFNEEDQDRVKEDLMTPEDREVDFWKRVFDYDPRIWETDTKFWVPGFKKGDF